MRRYPRNSPEALARVLAMAITTDAAVDDLEIELCERMQLFRMIGVTRAGFAQVVQDYCRDLEAEAGGRLNAGREVVEQVIADVDDPGKRLMVCAMMLSLCHADGRFDASELALMRHVLRRWNLTVEALRGMDVQDAPASRPAPAARPSQPERPRARYLRRERRWGEDAPEARPRAERLAE